jgi:hypothetical protein
MDATAPPDAALSKQARNDLSMMDAAQREQAVRQALDELTAAMEAFATAYAAWAADPQAPDARGRLEAAEAHVTRAREALEALEGKLSGHR